MQQTNRPAIDEPLELLAADVGGTFTDVIARRADGVIASVKLPSTPEAYEQAILAAASELGAGRSIQRLAHGTTVATNALLERRGARTALITTEGFRDVLELARLRRPSLFDLKFVKPEPLVPRDRRIEIKERTAADGSVLTAPDRAEVKALARRLAALGVDAVAICLLNSYANPANEIAVRDWLLEEIATSGRELAVVASSDIQREIREFERTSTAVINAYVTPTVSRYLERLTSEIGSRHGTKLIQIMQSNGSLIDSDTAARFPCRLIESGPAAGVLAAAALVTDLNEGNAIAFDMGGTTAKAALIEAGRPFEALQLEVGNSMNRDGASMSGSGYVIRAPSLDISEVGAGGGSIVWLDATGAPRLGPRSAGAVPGPACYGAGGTEPTVTDANLVLGFLGSEGIAGGRVPLHRQLAVDALESQLARPLSLSLADAAWGVHVLANVGMEAAVRAVSVERGRSPADYVLVAYGGAGPMHAATLAAVFGITSVVIPPRAGLLCAHGLTLAGVRHDAVQAYPPSLGVATEPLATIAADLEEGLRQRAGREADVELEWQLAMRYAGQPHELLVPFSPASDLAGNTVELVTERFLAEHRRTYGYADALAPIQIVSVRVAATRPAGRGEAPPTPTPSKGAGGPAAHRQAYFGPEVGWVETPVFSNRSYVLDCQGPLIVEEADSTVVVPPGWRATNDRSDRLMLAREKP